MDRKKLLKYLAYLICFIFVLNSIAIKLHWYYSMRYFDMPMHFLGGLWVGLAFIWFFPPKEISFKYISQFIFGVLLIGVVWEVYEIFVNDTIAQNPFDISDTLADMMFDLLGGMTGLLYFAKRIMSLPKVQL